jgi:hypothetical protein
MLNFLRLLLVAPGRIWRTFWAGVCLFRHQGWDLLCGRARTQLEELAVRQKEIELGYQLINNAINIAEKLQKIKDSVLRKKVKEMIAATDCTFLLGSAFIGDEFRAVGEGHGAHQVVQIPVFGTGGLMQGAFGEGVLIHD